MCACQRARDERGRGGGAGGGGGGGAKKAREGREVSEDKATVLVSWSQSQTPDGARSRQQANQEHHLSRAATELG